jgi:hypothetical protein
LCRNRSASPGRFTLAALLLIAPLVSCRLTLPIDGFLPAPLAATLTATIIALRSQPSPPSPAAGPAIFLDQGCDGCHKLAAVPGAEGIVGPELSSIGAVAAQRVPGMSARDHIYQSIVSPNAYVVADCGAGRSCPSHVMPENFGSMLTPQQLDTLIDFLLRQR